MPTYSVEDRFWHDFARLSPDQQRAFRRARKEFITILKRHEALGIVRVPQFPKHLGVKSMAGRPGIFEFAWAPDGRCTWTYGTPRRPGRFHIIWRRIGSHAIYDDP